MHRAPFARFAPFVAALVFASPLLARDPPLAVTTLTFPPGLPWSALKPLTAENPWGYDTALGDGGEYPVSLSIGDLDGDGRRDFLLCMEQRLLLAVGTNVDAQGIPTSLYVIWAWFDAAGPYFKHVWGKDRACIHDFDGDGVNEVVAIVGKASGQPSPYQNSFRVVVLGGTPAPDASFGNVPRPQVLASRYLDSLTANWTSVLTNGDGHNIDVQAFDDDPGEGEPRQILLSDSQVARFAILDWVAPDLEIRHHQYSDDASTHGPQGFDLDADGDDELLLDGIIGFHPPCTFDLELQPFFNGCSGGGNHADTIQPIDRDQDGDLDLVVAHDCFDFFLDRDSTLTVCNPVVVDSFQPVAPHGQDLTVGRFVNGADTFGYDGRDYLATPKGCPIHNLTNGGSYLMNGAGNTLAVNMFGGGIPNGPNGWGPRNIDWDGNRRVDEVFGQYGNRYSVWRLVATPGQGPSSCPNSQTVSYPYSWTEVATFDAGVVYPGQASWQPADVIGDYREELVVFGRFGVMFGRRPDVLATPHLHVSPFESLEYRRRFTGQPGRAVDYQRLHVLSRVRISPTTVARAAGATVVYRAYRIYEDAAGDTIAVDCTSLTTFASSDPAIASFNGNVLTTHAPGLAALNAQIDGLPQEEVPMILVGNGQKSAVVYAGFKDTHLTAAAPSDLIAEARVFDQNGDVAAVNFHVVGGAPLVGPNSANDAGQNGDVRANDGVWTLSIPGFTATTPHDDYVTATTLDQGTPIPFGFSLPQWPYLRIGGSASPVATGFANPWESELQSAAPWPRIRGTGCWPQKLATGGTGTIRVFARVTDSSVDGIDVHFNGALHAAAMNDAGSGADAFTGDGLWSGTLTISSPLPDGNYLIDFVPRTADAPSHLGDAYPRLRHHH